MDKGTKMTIIISVKELKGLTIFLLLLIMVIVFPLFLSIKSEEDLTPVEILGEKAGRLTPDFQKIRGASPDSAGGNASPVRIENASAEELAGIGTPVSVAATLVRFREKGKTFKNKSDLRSVYGMTEELLERISPFLIFEEETDGFVNRRKETSQYRKREESKQRTKERVYGSNSTKENSYPSFSGEKAFVSAGSTRTEEWIKAGMPDKLAATVVKYLSRGGRFEKQEDLFKIYGMDSAIYRNILPQVEFSVQDRTEDISGQAETVVRDTFTGKITLNNSTVQDWRQLPGVGASYAYRIVSYREKLGGFHHIEQLSEVYGLPDSLCERIREYITMDDFQPGLYINICDLKELYSHPYLDYKSAKLIIAFRGQHGNFKDFRDLQKIFGIDKKLLGQLEPYLVYD